jgi:hypothetical protein
MGATAFACLMLLEVLLGLAFGQSLATQMGRIATLPGMIGLGGQIAFALLPLARADQAPR